MTNFTKVWREQNLDFTSDDEVSVTTAAVTVGGEYVTPVANNDNLAFTKPWNAIGKLDFDSNDTGVAIYPLKIDAVSPQTVSTGILSQTYTFSIVNDLPEAQADMGFQVIIELGLSVNLKPGTTRQHLEQIHQFGLGAVANPVDCSGEVVNDINVDRGIKAEVESGDSNSNKLNVNVSDLFDDTPSITTSTSCPISDSKGVNQSVQIITLEMSDVDVMVTVPTQDGLNVNNSLTTINYTLEDVSKGLMVTTLDGVVINNSVYTDYTYPPRSDCEVATKWMNAEPIGLEIKTSFNSKNISANFGVIDYFEDAITPTSERPEVIEPPIEPIPAVVPPINFVDLWNNKGELDFLRIELDALIVMNEIDIYHVASNGIKTPVHPLNATLDFDIDSFVWSFSGQLSGESNLDFLTYRAIFEINVNGHTLRFILREYTDAQNFSIQAFNFTAVSSTQFLNSTHGELYAGSVEAVTGMWQLIQSKLDDANFELQRNVLTPEWNLEPDSFSYINLSSIDLAQKAASAAGAILKPDLLADILHIQPRYKVSPWNWEALTDAQCDHVIDADYITTVSSQDNETPQLNSVIISGEYKGVVTEAVLEGTAGDVWANDVLSPLSQDHSANNELARNIFADSGKQQVVGLKFPLLPPGGAFGLLLPGDIIRVNFENKVMTGLCLSNSVLLQSITDVWQQPQIEVNNGYS